MLYKDITSQVMANEQPTNKINIQRGVRKVAHIVWSCLCWVPSPKALIKADKRITGHITKYVRQVIVQSYADETTIIIGQPRKIKDVLAIYRWYAKLRPPKLPFM